MEPIIEEHLWKGQRLLVAWQDSGFIPPRNLVTQASGICFTHDGLIVLITSDGSSWGLPGGHPEDGETIEAALIREVREEACAMVTDFAYLGAQEMRDAPDYTVHYQTRFWARVQLNEFKPEYETTGRKLVMPEDVVSTLNWQSDIFENTLKLAIEHEKKFKGLTA